ncbi:MAG: hypothetical protein RIR86_2883 [Acidobacteriota bacterium]|jgi:hypothetical protein
MKTFALTLTVLILSMPVLAQETPRAELFLGYSALLTHSEQADLDDGVTTVRVKRETGYINGWNAALAVNANNWLGFVGDFSGHYGPIDYQGTVGANSVTLGSRVRVHQYLGGPQFSVRGDSTRLFVRALIGAVSLQQSISVAGLNIDERDTGLAVGAGGGLDVRISDRLAWRAFQADYFWYRFGQPKLIVNGAQISNSTTQKNFRISTGLVFKN